MVLFIDDEVRKEISEVLSYALEHPVLLPMLRENFTAGDDAFYACYLKPYYRCVFSYEQQPIGWCRHFSMSVESRDKLPPVPVVDAVMPEFGFKGTVMEATLKDLLKVWLEPEESPYAVNILSPLRSDEFELIEKLEACV